ncbi:glycosyltransferase [Corallococcus sp. CA053C]|uniref:glycosyltransferase family 4 protein n=1 Tax=Corallococcus sp. CA053C TaxID=2316732 RepID=UPI000EA18139|nr:glycosyltransferase family 4 protein [Corallococcus sp. CA053C]RKH11096.1 glycosyltransferase [Corallococcus sp. CA053C]
MSILEGLPTVCMGMLSTNGGSSIAALSLGAALRREGLAVRYLHCDPLGARPEDTRVLSPERALRAAHSLDVDAAFTSPLEVCEQLLRLHDTAPFGLLHLHNLQVFGLPAYFLKRLRGVPYVVTFHGSDVLNDALLGARPEVTREVLRDASAVTCVSRYLAEALAHRMPELPAPDVVHNFLRPELRRQLGPLLGPGAGMPDRFLHVSSLRPVKRPELLLASFARLHAQRPHATLRLVTTHRGAVRARELLESHPLRDAVTVLVGEDDMEVLAREYQQATALVLTSRFESFGLVMLEALAHGLPVVAPAVGGIPEVLGTDWPLLVRGDTADPDAYAERMAQVADGAARPLLRARAEEVLARFDGSRQVADYVRVYARALSVGSA